MANQVMRITLKAYDHELVDASAKKIIETVKKSVSGIVPVGATIFFAYCISNLFSATDVGANVGEYIKSWNLSVVAIAFIVPLATAILGMVLPGSAQTKIFGTTIIAVFASAGGNPLLAAVMLPVITGAMEGMTPPLALCMYTAMGIAGSKLKETTINCLIWVGLHYAMAVTCRQFFKLDIRSTENLRIPAATSRFNAIKVTT